MPALGGCGGGTADGLHLALRVAGDADQGVHDPVRCAVAAVDGHGDRIHQKWHVVVDDLDHRVVADKAVFGQRRVEDTDLGRVGRARCVQQAPVRIGYGKQGDGPAGL